jgi:hypothetical protein
MATAMVVSGTLAVGLTPAVAAGGHDRYALGDSVMLGAKGNLKSLGFAVVDAVESRQSYDGPGLLRKRGSSLPDNVVIHLGTNGTFPLDVCTSMVKAVGPGKRVFLVTIHVPRSWKKANNQVIRQCDAAFADDRVHVVEWDASATQHPQWLYSDGTHLRPDGAKGFARLIDAAIDDAKAKARLAAIRDASGTVSAGPVG